MRSIFTALLLLLCTPSFGQIVNIENLRLTDDKQGWSGRAEMNFNFIMNTRQLLQLGGEVRARYLRRKHQFLLVGDQSFVKSEDNDFVNRGFQHFRYDYRFTDSSKFYYEAFQQSQFNRIQRIDFRHLLGSGIRYDVINGKKYQLSLGSGLMWEYEELVDGGITRDLLSTSFLSFDGQFNESIGINTISYFQPKITNAGDYRFSNETSIRFKINKYLSFRVIYSLMHDSREIEGVRKTNYVFRNALQVSF
jgi:putative salt-induced outer membrane protein YdiY